MKRALAVAALLVATTMPAAAQETAVDSARTAAAGELVDLLQLGEQLTPDVSGFASGMMADNPAAARMAEVAMEFYREVMPWEKVRPLYVRIYQDAFSLGELRELIAFYRTPIGRKLIEKQPEISKGIMRGTQQLLLPHLPELQRRMLERMGVGGGN